MAASIEGAVSPISLARDLGDRWGVRMPATTSSPCALIRNSP
jgi:hypothetical protein